MHPWPQATFCCQCAPDANVSAHIFFGARLLNEASRSYDWLVHQCNKAPQHLMRSAPPDAEMVCVGVTPPSCGAGSLTALKAAAQGGRRGNINALSLS